MTPERRAAIAAANEREAGRARGASPRPRKPPRTGALEAVFRLGEAAEALAALGGAILGAARFLGRAVTRILPD